MTGRFALSYGAASKPFMSALGMGPGHSGVEVTDDAVRVQMGWSFRADIPRQSVVGVRRAEDVALTRGVHGWGGSWLVNGDGKGVVELDIDPPVQARMSGISIRLERLRVGVEDPEGFRAALSADLQS